MGALSYVSFLQPSWQMRERSARAKMLVAARREAVVKAFLCTPRVFKCIALDIVRIGCDRSASERVVH